MGRMAAPNLMNFRNPVSDFFLCDTLQKTNDEVYTMFIDLRSTARMRMNVMVSNHKNEIQEYANGHEGVQRALT